LKTATFFQKLEKETEQAVESRERIVRNWRKIRIQEETMPTMIEALNKMTREVDKYGWEKVLGGKWTLKELAVFVRSFNNSGLSESDMLVRRYVIGTFLGASHICGIRIPGVEGGRFESSLQAQRNGIMLPSPRTHMIELDIKEQQLNILKRQKLAICSFDQWATARIIPLAKIKKIRIVRVPAGLRHLEIELHTPCPN